MGVCGNEKRGAFTSEDFPLIPHGYQSLFRGSVDFFTERFEGCFQRFQGLIDLILDPSQVATHSPSFRFPCLKEALDFCFLEEFWDIQACGVGVIRPPDVIEKGFDFSLVRILGETGRIDSLIDAIGEDFGTNGIFKDDGLVIAQKLVALLGRFFDSRCGLFQIDPDFLELVFSPQVISKSMETIG